ncbi:Putative glycoside hydrolase family 47, six-hairpin glycosidase-like superfamily [Septoria linicola]|uniref:alpha-1,2-Mannosidase n=1 Tax=Septoria linicola TaxID=215465 RepID=A0A9Q9ASC5_9PEZI|nr:putative glycoside hydrolase family 47, six-hairpin glycosidase-like superfamily [Septoria linicola]USW52313.1 Putative glycoside hydrolase family 47, six-hairpin glycosidase-like superfamily [Septoria linicola]
MLPPLRRYLSLTLIAITFFVVFFHLASERPGHVHRHAAHSRPQPKGPRPIDRILHPGPFKPKFKWKDVKQKHAVDDYLEIPTGNRVDIPRVQHDFEPEPLSHTLWRKNRRKAVEEAFEHSWEGYKKNAWLQDEVSPLSGRSRNPFGGWGATLVDSLDTLWIMGRTKDFETAVAAIKKIDFVSTPLEEINVFETTIRYLGGLLAAYDVSGGKYPVLLEKSVEIGEMLYLAFDTPNRMPVTRWKWQKTALGEDQEPSKHSLLAEVGSLTLEFTRLSQITGDAKWYDAVARVTNVFEEAQNTTKIPGLWPTFVNAKDKDFKRDTTFTLGGMADSLYEYLPKEHILIGGQTSQYQNMFRTAIAAAKKNVFFRPLNSENRKMLLSGTVRRLSHMRTKLQPQAEHLACFAGGMVALAAKVFDQPDDMDTARELVDGCLWAYNSTVSGIMPEIFTALPCQEADWEDCAWDEDTWHHAVAETANHGSAGDEYEATAQQVIASKGLAPGFVGVTDPRYILRPEAIESVFVMYRITGDIRFQLQAWEMFQAITNATRTSIAFAALKDVTRLDGALIDNMESFWTAETLKYFYLIFSEPDVISLDDYVLNTEAHPLLRPK